MNTQRIQCVQNILKLIQIVSLTYANLQIKRKDKLQENRPYKLIQHYTVMMIVNTVDNVTA
jgi:hypothetical protein